MKNEINTEDGVVAAVYLCQISPEVSCGACCGLYNVPDPSRDALETMLQRRTAVFARIPRTIDAIDGFQKAVEGWTPRERPFPQFHHCPFLGMVGENNERVGCLLHPLAAGNNGTDWRGLSYYGGMACRTYFCPTHRHLSATHLRILRNAMDHWHPFGLIITERLLLAAFFQEIEKRLNRKVEPADFEQASGAAAILREFAALKMTWPYRPKGAPGPCNYFFENGEYPRPGVRRLQSDIPLSRYEDFFQELESAFCSPGDLQAAENLLDQLFLRLEECLA